MAYDFNQVCILGRLARDPEPSEGQSDGGLRTHFARFTIATTPGKDDEGASFFDCKAFDKVAVTIGQYCKKGKPIIVTGKLRQEKWQDKATGENRSKVVIMVQQVSFLPLPARDGEGDSTPAPDRAAVRARREDDEPSGGLPDEDDIPF